MSDIFKTLCQDTSNAKVFGICDDIPHQRAYIDTVDSYKWMALIQNESKKEITFTALDNCIEFNDALGKKESRCEGILTYHDTVIFIEIKVSKGNADSWAKDADKQLRNSIALVESKIDLSAYSNKHAAITNRLRNKSKQKHSVRMKQFYDHTGYILRINYRIVVD